MKPVYFIIALLAAALVYTTYRLVASSSPASETDTPDAATSATARHYADAAVRAIMTRTSVRAYSDRKVSDATVDTLLRAAMAAPTAMNRQPWQFVVIRDRAILNTIADNCKNISMAREAQLAIAVCGDMSLAIEGDGRDFWVQDCSAATENLLVAAHAAGLGAVWCGIYPIKERISFISGLLHLPENIIPLNIIPIGYPAAPSTPKEKYDAAKIHRNTF